MISLCSGPILHLVGWHPDHVYPDVLHVLYWGCARDFCSSVIILAAVMGYAFGVGTISERLRKASLHWKAWCTRNSYKPATKSFNRKNMKWKKRADLPQVPGKAMDILKMTGWLAEVCAEWAAFDPTHSMSGTAATGAAWLHAFVVTLERGGLFLTAREQQEAHYSGYAWMRAFSKLRTWACSLGLKLFAMRPKSHKFMCRVLDRLLVSPLNPRYFACFADEGLVHHICAIAKKCHPLQVGRACLSRLQAMIGKRWQNTMANDFKQ